MAQYLAAAVFFQEAGRRLGEVMMGSVEYLHLREIAEVDFE